MGGSHREYWGLNGYLQEGQQSLHPGKVEAGQGQLAHEGRSIFGEVLALTLGSTLGQTGNFWQSRPLEVAHARQPRIPLNPRDRAATRS
ncbi:MAG: hypothetical protein V3V08_19135 [Nannocystaceae bacterium]